MLYPSDCCYEGMLPMEMEEQFRRAVAALTAGKPVVFPTDTVYGVGVAVGLAPSPAAVFDVKRRDPDKAVPWLVGNPGALTLYGKDVPEYAKAAAEKYWPGPLTLIVKAAHNVPATFRAEDGTIALRMPNNPSALELIERVHFPLATSSANFQGERPPRSFDDVNPEFLAQVPAAVDDWNPRSGVSSTVVDCTGEEPRVLREGTITLEDLKALM